MIENEEEYGEVLEVKELVIGKAQLSQQIKKNIN